MYVDMYVGVHLWQCSGQQHTAVYQHSERELWKYNRLQLITGKGEQFNLFLYLILNF